MVGTVAVSPEVIEPIEMIKLPNRRRNRAEEPERPAKMDEDFDRQMAATASIMDRVTDSTLDDAARKKLFDDAVLAAVGWSRLADDGYCVESSQAYAQALIKILFGMQENRPDVVRAGADDIIRVARQTVTV